MVIAFTLISVFLVSLISFIGVLFIAIKSSNLSRIILLLVSFAAGSLFGDAFIHLLPEAFEHFENTFLVSILVITGIFIFFILEKFVRWRHCHIPTSPEHPHPMVTMNLIGDLIHNLIDGMIIGASYSVSIPIGIATTFAVIMHEIPQEIGDFGVFVHGGLSVRKALILNFLSALTAILGGIISLILGPAVKNYALTLLPLTAGGFIYIAGSDLIPELKGCETAFNSLTQLIAMACGSVVMALLLFLD
ncbi:MAG: ZIP family metal transporter [candidate division WOR-3 bacterium]|nr:ZIP family metal transporter [candidate division WOR-3 bacterium]